MITPRSSYYSLWPANLGILYDLKKKNLKNSTKNREMPLKREDFAIFGKIARESGSASQNRETHCICGELTGMQISPLLWLAGIK